MMRERVREAPAHHPIEDRGGRRPGLPCDETADDDVGIDDGDRRRHLRRCRAARVSRTARATADPSLMCDPSHQLGGAGQRLDPRAIKTFLDRRADRLPRRAAVSFRAR